MWVGCWPKFHNELSVARDLNGHGQSGYVENVWSVHRSVRVD